jgi:diamine N-acetyltransferase
MMTLQGEHIWLRALEPEDLDYVLQLENDEELWSLSTTLVPYSRFVIKKYLEQARADIFEVKQLRLAACLKDSHNPIGLIDLFDFDPVHRRAGIGIVMYPKEFRAQGYAKEVLQVLIDYAFTHLPLHQLYASVETSNESSLHLFKKVGFLVTGTRKQWNFHHGIWHDEVFLQLFKK